MIVAFIYLFLVLGEFIASGWTYHPNFAYVLIASGIISICDRLDKLIKKDGEPHA